MSLKRISPKHSLAIRWFHWLNFPILFIMIWSGTLIYWANDVYKIEARSISFQFYPDALYKALKIPYRLAEGMSYHFLFMWLFFFNGLLYVLYLMFSGEWKTLLPGKRSFKEAFRVVLYDLRLSKKKPEFKKYNAAQRIAYTMIILMGFMSLLSGLVIYKPAQFSSLTTLLGGYENARWIHFALTIGFVVFFFIHVVQVILAGWNNFRAIITGWEIIKTDDMKISSASIEVKTNADSQELKLTAEDDEKE